MADNQTEQERKTAGQRHVNIIWERTQSTIALLVTVVGMLTSAWLSIRAETENSKLSLVLISNVMMLVIGFYFGRTNHEKTGGAGDRESGERR